MKAKTASKKRVPSKTRMPKWKRRLEEYHIEDLVTITFSSEEELDAGTALIWGGPLMGVPFHLDPNGPSFVIPKALAPFFAKHGVKFTLHPVTLFRR